MTSSFKELPLVLQNFELKYSKLTHEEYLNGTCGVKIGNEWKYNLAIIDKSVPGQIICKITNHTQGA